METIWSKIRARIEGLIQKYRGKADIDQSGVRNKEESGGGYMSDQKFSRREWLFAIAVLLMVECWLLSVSYEFAGWQEVVNFISFAAAIASILLAVIAIIYGFIQSDSNSKTTGMLREQTESLKLHTKNLSESSESITKHLSVISDVTARLDVLDDNIRASVEKMAGVERTVEGMHASNIEIISAVRDRRASSEFVVRPSGDSISHDDLLEVIFSGSTFGLDTLGYAIYKYFKSGKKVQVFKFAGEFHKAAKAEGLPGITIFLCVDAILQSIGLYGDSDTTDFLVVNEKFEEVLRRCAEEALASEKEQVSKVIKRIDKFIDEM
ncbi:hypothetical protein L0Y47_05630 [Ectopseudomonas composti]